MLSPIRKLIVRNTIANYAGTTVLAALPILTLPAYFRLLGDEQWALVGFVGTLQALLSVLDAGMSQVLVREFVRRFGSDEPNRLRSVARLLKACEKFYFLMGIAAAGALILLSPQITDHWLNLSSDASHLGQAALLGAAGMCALQLLALLYRGVVVAAQEQVKLNCVLSAGCILRYGGGVIAVTLHPSVVSYLIWHVFTFALEVFARSLLAWHVAGSRRGHTSSLPGELRGVVGSMGVWVLAAMIGAVTLQMDKSILVAMRPIGELAAYFIASQVAAGALQLFYPVITAVLPVLLTTNHNPAKRHYAQLRIVGVLFTICVVVGSVTLLFGESIIAWWLDDRLAADVVDVLTILLAGVAFNAFCNIGYINWLAQDRRKRLLAANVAAFIVVSTVTPFAIASIGVRGAAIAFAMAQLTVLLVSLDWVRDAFRHR